MPKNFTNFTFDLAARNLYRNPIQADTNKDRNIDWNEFKALFLPGLGSEAQKMEAFTAMANPIKKGGAKPDDIISVEDLENTNKKIPVKPLEKWQNEKEKLDWLEAKAFQSTVALYKDAGGAIMNPELQQDPLLLNRGLKENLNQYAAYMGKANTDKDVVEAAEKSTQMRNEVNRVWHIYKAEEALIFKDITPGLLQKMVEKASVGDDNKVKFEKLSALKYSLDKFGTDRPELTAIQTEVATLVKNLKDNVKTQSCAEEATSHLRHIGEFKNEIRQVFLNSAVKAGIKADRALLDAYDKYKAKKLDGVAAAEATTKLEEKFIIEIDKILSNIDGKGLVNTFKRLEKENSNNAIGNLLTVINSSNLTLAQMEKLSGSLQAYQPNLFSGEAGDQVKGVLNMCSMMHGR